MTEEFLQHYGLLVARRLNPQAANKTAQNAVLSVIADLRAANQLPSQSNRIGLSDTRTLGPLAGKRFELVFVHDCRNHGCNNSFCVLCKHNPNKRCTGNFARKYWVGDKLLAKCEGEIQVELIEPSGARVTEDLSEYRIEVCILDGNRYNTKCREAGEQRLEILDDCEQLVNQKCEPLLHSAAANNTKEHPHVVLKFQHGTSTVPLRDMKVTESSESVLAGTKRPPFRLVVRAIHESGQRLDIRPAVSEEFVVVTKRTKNLKKQEIPSLDDPIAKLHHVGKETVKKLHELKASADEVQMDLGLPEELDRITKVKDFQKLTRLSEADGHLQQKLKQLLKLSKEKWEAACEHAKTAVQTDNRMRAWYMSNMSIGLLYTCSLGGVRPDCPVALLQNRQADKTEYMEVIPMEHQLPAQREQVQSTCEQAIKCWWENSHPGWMIFTLGNKHFESLDQIIQFSQGASGIGSIREQVQRDDQSLPTFPDFPEPDAISSDQSDGKGSPVEKTTSARPPSGQGDQSHTGYSKESVVPQITTSDSLFQTNQDAGDARPLVSTQSGVGPQDSNQQFASWSSGNRFSTGMEDYMQDTKIRSIRALKEGKGDYGAPLNQCPNPFPGKAQEEYLSSKQGPNPFLGKAHEEYKPPKHNPQKIGEDTTRWNPSTAETSSAPSWAWRPNESLPVDDIGPTSLQDHPSFSDMPSLSMFNKSWTPSLFPPFMANDSEQDPAAYQQAMVQALRPEVDKFPGKRQKLDSDEAPPQL